MRLLPTTILMALAITPIHAEPQEAIPVATVTAIKEATTFLKTDVDSEPDGPTMSGSGFLIWAQGTTGYLVTNSHVITPPRERKIFSTRPTTKVFFRSGTKTEARAVAEVVAASQERDLAILRVTNVPNLPKPIELKSDSEPFETMTVYIFGFPFGKALSMGKGNPPVNVGRGQVSSIRRNRDDRLKSVLVDGALNPGNSGGPVVDTKGKLVGVSVATIRGANIGFAIAIPELLDMLRGQAEEVNLTSKNVKNNAAEFAVNVSLLDPLEKIKTATLLYTTGGAKFSQTKQAPPANDDADKEEDQNNPLSNAPRNKEPETVYGPIEGAQKIPLNLDKQRASGILNLPLAGNDLGLWCQVSFVDGLGKTVFARPSRHFFSAVKSNDSKTSLTFWGEVVDPDGDCELKLETGTLKGDIPGTLHDLNIDIAKVNAPRVVQAVDGDFIVSVKVTGTFHPGSGRTGPKSVPYNGGGLVLWLDQDHYIRLERASMYRNNRVMGFVAFESREFGTRAEVHNKGGLDPNGDLWLRLKRDGSSIAGSFSKDGQDWVDLDPMNVEWPSRLKVGVDIVNSCSDPMNVRFQEYSLQKTAEAPNAKR